MTNLGNVNFNQPRRGKTLGIDSGQGTPTDFRYPGEPEEGRSPQAQSWVDAGQDLKNWFQMEPFGFFKDIGRGIADFAQPAMDWYGENIYPYTPGARLDPNVERPDSWFTNPIGGEPFSQRPPGDMRGSGSSASEAIVGTLAGADAAADEPTGRTIEQLMALAAQYAPQGPDYSAVRQQMMDDTEALNAQLQAMYAAAADRAGENVARLGDIYGGAQAGIGAAYDTGTGNVEEAYASAQQQAADQLARLGIEETAPTVVDPMALSQAESVASLESGRAAGLSAANRYGATAQDFGSQMAQVLQQEGLGQNQALLAALQGRLGNLAIREAEAQGQYNPIESALQYLQLEQAMNPPEQGPDLDFEFKRDQANIDNYYRLYSDLFEAAPGESPAELHNKVRDYILTGAMGEDLRQWVLEGNAPTDEMLPGVTPGFNQSQPQGNAILGLATNPLQYLQ